VHAAEPMPEGVTLPLVVWDVDFNDNPLDAPPQPLTKEQIESQSELSAWQRLPNRRQMGLEYVPCPKQLPRLGCGDHRPAWLRGDRVQ
jgi:hypothetical protein